MEVFLLSASQISLQKPLVDEWFDQPIEPSAVLNESQEPDYRAFITPMEARRMGRLLKRAVVTAIDTLQKGNCPLPDAVITGTGLGCVENTERFLNAVIDNDEEFLPPTPFMQSTHNTISSQVALKLKCHGYNSTYSHRGTSFDSALLDACMQMQLGKIDTALVSGHDEMTPDYFRMLGKIGYWRDDAFTADALRQSGRGSISGSCSCSFLLSQKPDGAVCRIRSMEMLYRPSVEEVSATIQRMLSSLNLNINDVDAVVTGFSGDQDNDAIYREVLSLATPNVPDLWYKHIFGESFTSSSFGLYTAFHCLKQGRIPTHLFHDMPTSFNGTVRNILVYNHSQNIDHSLMLVSLC